MNTKFFQLSSRYSRSSTPDVVQTTFKVKDTVHPLISEPAKNKATITLVKAIINATQIPMLFSPNQSDYVISPYKYNPNGNSFMGYSGWGDTMSARLTKSEYYTIEDILYELNSSIPELWYIAFNTSNELTITLSENVTYGSETPVFPDDTTIAVSTELKNLLECFPGMFVRNQKANDYLAVPGTVTNIAQQMWILNLSEFRRRSAQGEAGAQYTPGEGALVYYPQEPVPVPEDPSSVPTPSTPQLPSTGLQSPWTPTLPGTGTGFTGYNNQPLVKADGPLPYINPAYRYKYWTVTSHFPNFNRFFTIRTIEFHAEGLNQQPVYISNADDITPTRSNILNSVNIDSGFNNSLVYYHPYNDLQTYYLTTQNDIYEFDIKLYVTYSNGSRVPLMQLSTDESTVVMKVEYGTDKYQPV